MKCCNEYLSASQNMNDTFCFYGNSVLLCRCGSEARKVGSKGIKTSQISTLKSEHRARPLSERSM